MQSLSEIWIFITKCIPTGSNRNFNPMGTISIRTVIGVKTIRDAAILVAVALLGIVVYDRIIEPSIVHLLRRTGKPRNVAQLNPKASPLEPLGIGARLIIADSTAPP